jgi:Integrase zinc binding domain
MNAISTVEFDRQIRDDINKSYTEDQRFSMVIKNPERYPLYQFEDGLLFFEGRLCIPANDRVSHEKLLKLHHDNLGNHFAVDKTHHSLIQEYYWPGVHKDVEHYIKLCASCSRNKSSTQAPARFLHPMPIPE